MRVWGGGPMRFFYCLNHRSLTIEQLNQFNKARQDMYKDFITEVKERYPSSRAPGGPSIF